MSESPPADEAQLLSRFDAHERGKTVCYGLCGGIWVMTMFAPPTAAEMRLALGTLTAAKRRHPGGFPTLTWILPTAGLRMDDDARHAAAEVTNRFETSIRCQATLIEGSGFRTAAVRAIVAGVDVLSRSASEKKVFAELLPAVSWCLARCPEPREVGAPSAADITKTLIAARDAWCRV